MPRVRAVVRFPATGEMREIRNLTVAVDDVSRADAAAESGSLPRSSAS